MIMRVTQGIENEVNYFTAESEACRLDRPRCPWSSWTASWTQVHLPAQESAFNHRHVTVTWHTTLRYVHVLWHSQTNTPHSIHNQQAQPPQSTAAVEQTHSLCSLRLFWGAQRVLDSPVQNPPWGYKPGTVPSLKGTTIVMWCGQYHS